MVVSAMTTVLRVGIRDVYEPWNVHYQSLLHLPPSEQYTTVLFPVSTTLTLAFS